MREQSEMKVDLVEEFPILEQMTFLNHAAVAPISGRAAKAIEAYAKQASTKAYVGAGWYSRANRVKELASELIGARGRHEMAFVPNTSTGLAMVARGINWKQGDHVVVTGVEYPANRYPWEDLQRQGVKLIEVPQLPDGRIDVEDVTDAITDRTRVVSISHVQYASGHRIDLAPISEVVHKAGGYLCVDGIQSVGVLPVDVQAMGVDFLAADGHKWMLGPEGAGIFYCHQDLVELLHPAVVGWMNMVEAHDFGHYRFEFQPDARRFEPGSWNIPGILGLGASLELLLEVGIEQVWARVEGLTARLCEGLEQKDYRVFSPRQWESERSGIVIFEPGQGKPEAGQIVQGLREQNIEIVVREGRLRTSPHFYNSAEQIEQLVEALP